MIRIHFPTQPHQTLAQQILLSCGQNFAVGEADGRTFIDVANDELGQLLKRTENRSATLLPLWGEATDRWLLVAEGRHAITRALPHITSFLVPSFAELEMEGGLPRLHNNGEDGEPLPAADAVGYPLSVHLVSPLAQRHTILRRAVQWAQLEAATPALSAARPPRYAELLHGYRAALANGDWPVAEAACERMRSLHLTSFDNLQYLRLELLARQERWHDLWKDRAYTVCAETRMPAAVRETLITALYYAVLDEHVQTGDVEELLSAFRTALPRPGSLLTGRFRLNSGPVMRVFAVQAAFARDAEAFEELEASSSDAETAALLALLRPRLPAGKKPTLSVLERLQDGMQRRDYDAAHAAALELANRVERALFLLRIAFHHPGASDSAIAAYDALAEEERAELHTEPAVNAYLERILGVAASEADPYATWSAWFQRLMVSPDDVALAEAMERLLATYATDLQDSTGDGALPEGLWRLASEREELLRRPLVQNLVRSLIVQTLQDGRFPREGGFGRELYGALLDCQLILHEVNESESVRVVRLAEGCLRLEPQRSVGLATDLRRWFDRPLAVLENSVLDAFELLIAHGAGRPQLYGWFHDWLEALLDRPASSVWDRTAREVWYALGAWLWPGDPLLEQLRDFGSGSNPVPEADPVASLAPATRVAIFTLNEDVGRRAQGLLLGRNAGLDINLCHDTVLTESARVLAANADVVVLVTTCMKHALFYGIQSQIRGKILYPTSSGTTSLVRAIEEYGRSLARIGSRGVTGH